MPVVVTAPDRIAVERPRGSTRRCCRGRSHATGASRRSTSVRDGDHASRDAT
ncbi:hypothetical protein [Halorubellus sp. PRR65]|uniref:hypothetical protein n=1 Tax=Halorubellus sp. PRR65 TaxID=3098148 RepID=UPI002B25D732|nr:hypothetical protein [Halorubellus sp. PRR65]